MGSCVGSCLGRCWRPHTERERRSDSGMVQQGDLSRSDNKHTLHDGHFRDVCFQQIAPLKLRYDSLSKTV